MPRRGLACAAVEAKCHRGIALGTFGVARKSMSQRCLVGRNWLSKQQEGRAEGEGR